MIPEASSRHAAVGAVLGGRAVLAVLVTATAAGLACQPEVVPVVVLSAVAQAPAHDEVARRHPIRLEPPAVDLGLINRGERAVATVRLVNTSSRSVRVLDVKTCCGCTVVELPAGALIDSGDALEVGLSLTSRGAPGTRVSKTATFLFEDGIDPLRVPIEARVFAHVAVSPTRLRLPLQRSHVIEVEALDGQPFRITGASAEQLRDRLPTAPSARHALVLSPKEVNGLSKPLRLTLDHPAMEVVEIEFVDSREASAAHRERDHSTSPLLLIPRRIQLSPLAPSSRCVVAVRMRDVARVPGLRPMIVSAPETLALEIDEWSHDGKDLLVRVGVRTRAGASGRIAGRLVVAYGSHTGAADLRGRALDGSIQGQSNR